MLIEILTYYQFNTCAIQSQIKSRVEDVPGFWDVPFDLVSTFGHLEAMEEVGGGAVDVGSPFFEEVEVDYDD